MVPNDQNRNQWMDSLMRITLAGFGGAVAGLSISRGRSQAVVRNSMNRKVYSDPDLPSTWAVACMSYVGIMECSYTLVTPTFHFLSAKSSYFGNDILNQFSWLETPYTSIVGDYTIGGAVAGAIFKGANIKTETGRRKLRKLTPPVQNIQHMRTGVMVGMIPGLLLGFVAGCLQASIQYLETIAGAEVRKQARDLRSLELKPIDSTAQDAIVEEVKKLSVEELKQEIQRIKGKSIKELKVMNDQSNTPQQ